jgi:hypothetical protein
VEHVVARSVMDNLGEFVDHKRDRAAVYIDAAHVQVPVVHQQAIADM